LNFKNNNRDDQYPKAWRRFADVATYIGSKWRDGLASILVYEVVDKFAVGDETSCPTGKFTTNGT
jgi:hypothetical protein